MLVGTQRPLQQRTQSYDQSKPSDALAQLVLVAAQRRLQRGGKLLQLVSTHVGVFLAIQGLQSGAWYCLFRILGSLNPIQSNTASFCTVKHSQLAALVWSISCGPRHAFASGTELLHQASSMGVLRTTRRL